MRPTVSFSGHPFFFAVAANWDRGVAKSGVKGPDENKCEKREIEKREKNKELQNENQTKETTVHVGLEFGQIQFDYLIVSFCNLFQTQEKNKTSTYLAPSSATRRSLFASQSLAMSALRVAARYCAIRGLYGNSEVVAPARIHHFFFSKEENKPISAPMLQIVPIPVQDMDLKRKHDKKIQKNKFKPQRPLQSIQQWRRFLPWRWEFPPPSRSHPWARSIRWFSPSNALRCTWVLWAPTRDLFFWKKLKLDSKRTIKAEKRNCTTLQEEEWRNCTNSSKVLYLPWRPLRLLLQLQSRPCRDLPRWRCESQFLKKKGKISKSQVLAQREGNQSLSLRENRSSQSRSGGWFRCQGPKIRFRTWKIVS